MEPEKKLKLIEEFLDQLKVKETPQFILMCGKCGSSKIENSYEGEGVCVAPQSYTASFNGKHFIKCLECGNATTDEFYVSINGVCGN